MTYEIAGRVQFGDITGVEQMTITRSRGIQPSTIQLVVPYLPRIPTESANLTLSDGINSIVFRDCILKEVAGDYTEGDRFVVTILDSRWKWKFGQISGEYNTIRADTIVKETKKKPQELAVLCLKEMGVAKYDVKSLPNNSYPEIAWNLEVPAVALESLCTNLGCVVCLQLDGSVLIAKQGEGKELPVIKGCQISETIKAETVPDHIYVSAAPTVWEVSLEIDSPMGLQDNGDIDPIDKLLYKPKTGWGNEDPRVFANVDIDKRKLALESVWRWFRFKMPIKLPELPFEVLLPHQLFIEDALVEKQKLLGIESRKPRLAYGRFYDLKDSMATNVKEFSHDYDVKTYTSTQIKKRLIYEGGFEIDQDKMIVKFSDPVFLYDFNDPKTKYKLPDIRLRVAVSIKDPKTNVRLREVYQLPTKRANRTQPLWVRKDEVRREIVVDPKTGGIKSVVSGKSGGSNGSAAKLDNVDEVKKKLKEIAEFELRKFEAVKPQQGTYQGFPAIELDGTIEQVTYTIGGDGFSGTVASYGTEHSFVVPSFEERQRTAKLEAVLAEQLRTLNANPDTKTQR